MAVLRDILGDGSYMFKKQVKPGTKTKFSDMEVMALMVVADYMGYNSERYFFAQLSKDEFPDLLSRRQFNDRRKRIRDKFECVREPILARITTNQQVFVIDSMPLRICRLARSGWAKIGRQKYDKIKPNIGRCASHEEYYFGFKLHAVCSFEGAIQFFDMTRASFSDVQYLDTVAKKLKKCRLIGDKGYISAPFKQMLKEESKVSLLTDSKENCRPEKITFIPIPYRKYRKRIETIFSQLNSQFKMQENFAKTLLGYFTRVESKILTMTILNYVNQINNRPIGKIKYALM